MQGLNVKNAVIHHSPFGDITGSLVDSIDYFLALQSNGIDCLFISIGIKLDTINLLCRSRYLKAQFPQNRFIYLRHRFGLLGMKFGQVLLSYSSLRRVYLLLNYKKLLVLPSQLMRYDYNKNKIVSPKRSTFLLDPEQHPYKLQSRKDYRKKILLSEMSTTGKSRNNVLVSCISKHKRHHPQEIVSTIEALDIQPEKIVILGKRKTSFPKVEYLRPPIPRLFDQYSYYLYLPSLNGYDENPRLLIESAWLKKSVLIPQTLDESDGAYLKWQNIQQNIQDFFLGPKDLVVQYFLNY
jgi:hypothetical protein